MSESTATGTATPAGRPAVTLAVVALDTDEPRRLADFYAALLGWQVSREDDDWVEIRPLSTPSGTGSDVADGSTSPAPMGAVLAFQLVINYVPPTWPTQSIPQQLHLDLDVLDLDEGELYAVTLGAQRVPNSGVEGDFRVFLDPSGHPFCLCKAG
jgi:Glyoxalase-like domain